MKRLLIIGGVAGGAGAAAKARRVNEDCEIVLFERGSYVSFANCGLPYYIGKVIEDREELLLFTPELFKSRFNVDVRLNTEIVDLDRKKKTVTAQGPDGKTYKEKYDKLVIATGGKPITLRYPEPIWRAFTMFSPCRMRTPSPPNWRRAPSPQWWSAAALSAWRAQRTWLPGASRSLWWRSSPRS